MNTLAEAAELLASEVSISALKRSIRSRAKGIVP
jgi:hypothetical protein